MRQKSQRWKLSPNAFQFKRLQHNDAFGANTRRQARLVNMSKPNIIQVCFVRVDGASIDALRVVEFTAHAETKEDALNRLERAVTKWIRETNEGKAAWRESSEDLNIGDLAAYFDARGNVVASLKPFLKQEGILNVRDVFVLTNTAQESYDRVLANSE